MGWSRVPNSRALGRSTRRSKKRSTRDMARTGESLPEASGAPRSAAIGTPGTQREYERCPWADLACRYHLRRDPVRARRDPSTGSA